MATRGGAKITISGDVTEALAALDRLGIRAAEVGKETESKLGGAGEHVGGVFGKLGNTLGNWGVPFSDALNKIGDKFKEIDKAGGGTKEKLAEIGKVAVLGAAAGFGVVAAESVKLGENYQQATAKIAASSGVTIAAAKNVSDQFLKTGFSSTFSAQEMATAYGQVAGQLKATEGHALSASDAMSVMKASTDLAEASGASLGDSTSALAAVMQAYGLKAGDAAKASDQLYNIATITNQPIAGLAAMVDRLKGRLGDLAPSLQDVGTLMAFPAVAAQGSRGVMTVNTALTTLLGGSKNVSKELGSLGVHIFNASGKFIGFRGVIEQLQPKLARMSQAQQIAAEKTLFGSSAAQLMGKVIQGGTPAYDKAAHAVGKLGSAHKAAEKQSNTLKGQTEKLKAGMEDLGVRLGSWLIPKLEELAQVVGNVIGWFERHRDITLAVAAVIGGVLLGAVIAYTAAMIPAAAATIAAAAPFIAIGVAIAAVVAAAIELVKHWSTVWHAIEDVAKAAWNDGIKPVFEWIKTIAIEPIKLEIQGLETVWSTVWGTIKSVLNTAWGFIQQVFGWIKTIAILPIQTAISTLGSVWGHIWGGVQSAVQTVWSVIKPILDTLLSMLNAIKNAWNDLTGALNIGNSKSFQNILNGKLPSGQAVPRGLDGGNALAGAAPRGLIKRLSGGWIPGAPGHAVPMEGHGSEYVLSVPMLQGSQPIDPSVLAAVAKSPQMPGTGSGGGIVNNITAITNASAQQIAAELDWALRQYAR